MVVAEPWAVSVRAILVAVDLLVVQVNQGSGDHSGTSADGFGGFGGSDESRATFRAAQAAISAGVNPFASSTQMAVVAMANPTNQAIQDEAERFGKVTEGLGKKGEKSL